MWHSWLDKGKELAEQAKRAAAELEGRLDESAGVVVATASNPAQQQQQALYHGDLLSTTDHDDDAGALDDHWDDDDDNDEMSLQQQQRQQEEEEEEAGKEGEFTTTSINDEGVGNAVKTDLAESPRTRTEEEEEAEPSTGENVGGWAEEDEELDIDVDDEQEVALEHTPLPDSEQEVSAGDDVVQQEAEKIQQSAEPLNDGMTIIESVKMVESPATARPSGEREMRQELPHNESDPSPPQQQHHGVVGFLGALAHTPTSKGILGGLSHLAHQIPLKTEQIPTVDDDENKEEEDQEDIVNENSQDVESPLAASVAEAPPELVAADTPKEGENVTISAVDTADIPGSELKLSGVEISTAHGIASEEVARFMQQQAEYRQMMEAKIEELQLRLSQREDQMLSKTEQLTKMEIMYESEKQELVQKIQSTKEEAKRRIQKAKEHVEAIELKLKTVTSSQGSSAEELEKRAEIIAALREEGAKLARKQADMEAAVRAAKGEARELREQLEGTEAERETALEKIEKLQAELKVTKEDLASARKGESRAGKLDSDLRHVREESEKRAATILSLEQQIKELRASHKEMKEELESTRQGAAVETEQERRKLRKEHIEQVADMEAKLQISEREAAVREDALRHEVDELRKRWQDAVRRADALSVDVQSSAAPLLRQLESTNKQNRARAAAWAELETQLRAELEESVILNEQLAKERSDWKTKCIRLERSTKEYETELKQLKGELHDKSERMQQLEHELEELKTEGEKMKTEWAEVERLANEGVSRVRSEMTRTVVDAEERHRAQIDSMEAKLTQEREQRTQLEKKLEGLLENAGMFVPQEQSSLPLATVIEDKPKRLRHSEDQADILAGALDAFGSDGENSDDEDEKEVSNNGTGSFAALEQLTSRLKASKVELITLRKRLEESEKTREELVQVLAESRNAREKLPLFEAKVQELTKENEALTLEVQGLREDIAETRDMYRTQLNVLLEAQAAGPHTNGDSKTNTGIVEANEEQPLEVMNVEASPSGGP